MACGMRLVPQVKPQHQLELVGTTPAVLTDALQPALALSWTFETEIDSGSLRVCFYAKKAAAVDLGAARMEQPQEEVKLSR